MAIRYLVGDLFALLPPQRVCVPHVCNDHGKFGAGFALALAGYCPEVQKAYFRLSESGQVRLGITQFYCASERVIFANMIAQTLGGRRPLFYNHLVTCMDEVGRHVAGDHAEIYCPAFGTGLAGGDWRFIRELISDCWLSRNIPVTVCVLTETAAAALKNSRHEDG